jgi:hypothetical protein
MPAEKAVIATGSVTYDADKDMINGLVSGKQYIINYADDSSGTNKEASKLITALAPGSIDAGKHISVSGGKHIISIVLAGTVSGSENTANSDPYEFTNTEKGEQVHYRIIEGENGNFPPAGDSTLSFRANGEMSEFEAAGKKVTVTPSGEGTEGPDLTETTDFSYSSGSTIVELSNAYLSGLDIGKYTLKVYFPGGKVAETEFTVAVPAAAFSEITITDQPKDVTVRRGAINSSLEVKATSSPERELTYQWYECSKSGEEMTAIEGAASSKLALPKTLGIGKHYYRCKVSVLGGNDKYSEIARVTVKAHAPFVKGKMKYTPAGENTAYCSGTTNKKAKKLTIPKAVVYGGVTYKIIGISSKAFAGHKALKAITIGDNVKTIKSAAFFKCRSLSKVTIGKNVTSIGKHAFCRVKSGCVLKFKGAKAPSIDGRQNHKISGLRVKVPAGSLKAYKKAFTKAGMSSVWMTAYK